MMMIGRATSSASFRSTCQTILRRFSISLPGFCVASSLSTSGLQYFVKLLSDLQAKFSTQRHVGIIDARARQIEGDGVVLPLRTAKPDRRLDDLEFGLEVHLVELVDEEDGWILVGLEVARRDLDLQLLGGAMAKPLHQLAGLGQPFLEGAAVTRQRHQHVRRHAPDALGLRHHAAREVALAVGEDGDEALPVEAEGKRLAQDGIVERRPGLIDQHVDRDVGRPERALHLWRPRGDVPQQRHGDVAGRGQIVLAGDHAENARRAVADDVELDGIQERPVLAPVVGIAGELDDLVALELDELEGAGADRRRAHVLGRDVAGIDRRVARGEHRQQRGLWPVEHERDLVIARRA